MEEVLFFADNLTIEYGQFSVRGVNFQLKEGDILGLIGASGSGKSTIIKTLVGSKEPAQGNISLKLKGNEVNPNQHIGYSPQENSLYPF